MGDVLGAAFREDRFGAGLLAAFGAGLLAAFGAAFFRDVDALEGFLAADGFFRDEPDEVSVFTEVGADVRFDASGRFSTRDPEES